MGLRGIDNYDNANKFLKKEYLRWCNSRYTLSVESVYKHVPNTKVLDLIFSIKLLRKANKDNTVRCYRGVYPLLSLDGVRSFAGKWGEKAKSKG